MNEFDSDSVYIIASERSGTNLLRKLLTQSQNVYFGPSPGHFLKHLFYKAPYYGSFEKDENFSSLINDMLDLATVHFSPWQINWDIPALLSEYDLVYGERRNVILLSHFLCRKYAREQGFKSYICKDNDIFEFYDAIKHELPNAKFVYLHRDPRDVALSQYERTLQTNSLAAITALWRYEQIKCIRISHANPKSVYQISYEDILDDEDKAVENLCAFLGVPVSQTRNDAKVFHGLSKEWENLDKPTLKENKKKYVNKFSMRQIQFIESRVYTQMEYLGYNVDYPLRKFSKVFVVVDTFWGSLKAKGLRFIKREKADSWSKERSRLLKRISLRDIG